MRWRNHWRHILYRVSFVMGMLMEFQDIFHQLLFRLINIENRYTGKLKLRTVTGQNNCFSFSGKKESIVFHIDLCRYEIMGIHIRCVIH